THTAPTEISALSLHDALPICRGVLALRAGGGGVTKTVALALGGGGARGLAHVAVLEALDEMGVRPGARAGGAVGDAAGMRGRETRRYAVGLVHNRPDFMARLMRSRAGKLSSLFAGGFG